MTDIALQTIPGFFHCWARQLQGELGKIADPTFLGCKSPSQQILPPPTQS